MGCVLEAKHGRIRKQKQRVLVSLISVPEALQHLRRNLTRVLALLWEPLVPSAGVSRGRIPAHQSRGGQLNGRNPVGSCRPDKLSWEPAIHHLHHSGAYDSIHQRKRRQQPASANTHKSRPVSPAEAPTVEVPPAFGLLSTFAPVLVGARLVWAVQLQKPGTPTPPEGHVTSGRAWICITGAVGSLSPAAIQSDSHWVGEGNRRPVRCC